MKILQPARLELLPTKILYGIVKANLIEFVSAWSNRAERASRTESYGIEKIRDAGILSFLNIGKREIKGYRDIKSCRERHRLWLKWASK